MTSINYTVDSRDLEERIDELEAQFELDPTALDAGDLQELKDLRDARDEIGDEWVHGVYLIADDEIEDYLIELVKDVGDLPKEIPSYIVIDWKATAQNLLVDYSYLEILGTKYWYRA